MKKNIFIFSILILLMVGCGDKDSGSDDTELIGNWKQFATFEGYARSDAVAFTIEDKAYVGTGYDGTNRLNDFWEYDPQLNNWTRRADFPGVARSGAVAFTIGTKGYVGTGYDGMGNKLKDFWVYDPITNKWDTIADFAGSARYGAIAFSINNKGYVGTGYDGNYLKDIWEYDPSTNQWTQKVSMPGEKRRDAVAFVIAGKAYICTGINNGAYVNDFWEYDPIVDQWSKKRYISNVSDEDYDDGYSSIIGINKVAFSVNGKGYVATGGQGTAGADVWEYDPTSDLWTQKTSLEASGRIEAVAFTIKNSGYITTGRNGSSYFDDLWGFEPDAKKVSLDKISSIVGP